MVFSKQFQNPFISDLMILAGVHNLDHLTADGVDDVPDEMYDNIQVRNARSYYIHPEYNSISDEHDIAVLELDEPLTLTDYVQPACLPDGVWIGVKRRW